MKTDRKFSDSIRLEISSAMVLEAMLGDTNHKIKTSLEYDDQYLQDIIDEMLKKELLKEGTGKFEGYYRPTEKGQEFFQNQIYKISSFNTHFNIFSKVDLEEGSFAYETEEQAVFGEDCDSLSEFLKEEGYSSFDAYSNDDERWDDCRLAVIEMKDLNPFQLVFYSMLSRGDINFEKGWQKRLDDGRIFDPVVEVVETYPTISWFEGGQEEVEAIIKAGAEENERRAKYNHSNSDQEEVLVEEVTTEYYVDPWWEFSFFAYDPWPYYGYYYDPYYYDPYWDVYWW